MEIFVKRFVSGRTSAQALRPHPHHLQPRRQQLPPLQPPPPPQRCVQGATATHP